MPFWCRNVATGAEAEEGQLPGLVPRPPPCPSARNDRDGDHWVAGQCPRGEGRCVSPCPPPLCSHNHRGADTWPQPHGSVPAPVSLSRHPPASGDITWGCPCWGGPIRDVPSGCCPSPHRDGYLSAGGVRSTKPHHFPVRGFVLAAAFGKCRSPSSAVSCLLPVLGCFGAGGVPTGGFGSAPGTQKLHFLCITADQEHHPPCTPRAPRSILVPMLCPSQGRVTPRPQGHPPTPSTPSGALGSVGGSGLERRPRTGGTGACGDEDAAADVSPALVLPRATGHPGGDAGGFYAQCQSQAWFGAGLGQDPDPGSAVGVYI